MNWIPHQDLNEIILEKDSIVQGLQNQVGALASVHTLLEVLLRLGIYQYVHQVVDLTGREGRVLEGCLHKDQQIDAQYSALAGLNNLTVLQVCDGTLSSLG